MDGSVECTAPEGAVVEQKQNEIAPWQHTGLVLAMLALMATCGARYPPTFILAHLSRNTTYLCQMSVTWLLTGVTIAGLYHRRQFLSDAFGRGRVRILRDIGGGFLVYLGGLGTTVVLAVVLFVLHHPTHKNVAAVALAPHAATELPLWILMSLTAGVCEEFVFRGYLQQQFRRWFGRTWVAVVLSSLIFALMHIYEGSSAVIGIGGLGLFYGLVAVRRGNLRQVMVAHFFQDALTGVLLFLHH
jgi:membrane protease YdiL (CAAX protease family)